MTVRLTKAQAFAVLASPNAFITAYGIDADYDLRYDDDPIECHPFEPASHSLHGNLLNIALHLEDEIAACVLLDRGIAIEPAAYQHESALGWLYIDVHPIEPASRHRMVAATRKMLERGIDFNWRGTIDSDAYAARFSRERIGIEALGDAAATETLVRAGWDLKQWTLEALIDRKITKRRARQAKRQWAAERRAWRSSDATSTADDIPW